MLIELGTFAQAYLLDFWIYKFIRGEGFSSES